MKMRKIPGAKSLCAVLLALSLLFALLPAPVRAQDSDSSEANAYQYAVTIEFGSLTFYYDYGAWDVDELRYRAAASSQNPANGTEPGFPGWYGFDGTANAIRVQYTNKNEADSPEQNRRLAVSLSYRPLADSEGRAVSGVSMQFFSDPALTQPISSSFTVSHTPAEDTAARTTVYASLTGEPVENGGKYLSESFSPIGMLTISVGEITD